MPGSSNSNQVYEANLSTFRAFRATIDDLKSHAWAPYGDQASLVRRVQEWRKTIGHLTMWVQDVRAYYDQARPEIVCLLEYAYDSVSEVDRVRNAKGGSSIIRVADNDFVNILLDYIRLINTAFSPERQTLYSTPEDQEYLTRGRVLYDGLHTFHIRLNSLQKQPRQSSTSRINQPLSQPVSPVTSTHPLQSGPSTQASAHPRSMSGNHVLPMHSTRQPISSQPQRTHTHQIPAGTMVPVQHPLPQKSQSSFIRPPPNANPAPQPTWTQPMTQRNLPSYVPPNIQQTSSVGSTGPTISIPSAPPVPVEAASAPISPMDTEAAEPDLPWGLSWEELEALDRSEWEAGMANKDDPADSTHGNVLPEGGLATEIGTIPEPISVTNQHTSLQSTQSPGHPIAHLVGQPLEERILIQEPAPAIETVSGQVQVQPASTPPILPKEEAQSPRALLSASPPPPPPSPLKVMTRLERRESLLAADVIDIEELSDDGSSASEPLASAVDAPPAASPNDIIDIEDSDEEEQNEPESVQPQAGSPNQPRPLATSPLSGLPRAPSENRVPTISASVLSQPFEGTPALASNAIPNADSATDHPSSDVQPTPGVSIVLPGHKNRAPSKQMRPTTNQELPRPERMSPLPSSVGNESHDMDVDQLAGESSIAEAGVQLPAEDFEMANGESETAAVDSTLNPASSANGGQTETSLMPMSPPESIKDANTISPEVLVRIRQIAEEPLITWYIASDPSMSREVAKEKYKHMSDQEVYNLFLKIRPIIENLKVRVEAVNTETSVESLPPSDIARSSVLNEQNAGLKRSLSPHTATLVETGIPRKLARKLVLPANIVSDVQPEPPTLLCALSGVRGLSNATVEFTVSAELMTSLKRWKARYLTPAGLHGELRTVELACYSPEAFYPTSEGGSLVFTPNAQLRTWPNGGVLRAFINEGIRPKAQEINLYLSPPPFTKIDESLDLSEFIQEGRNTVRFLHLGGMENFVFVVQARKMSPPGATWSAVLKRVREFTENPGYQGLLARLSERIK